MNLFNSRFKSNHINSSSFIEFESNVKQIKMVLIGASVLPAVGQGEQAWEILMNEFDKSTAVIMRGQELISSLLDKHGDLETVFSLKMRRQIKAYLDDACREYVRRNTFKVNTF